MRAARIIGTALDEDAAMHDHKKKNLGYINMGVRAVDNATFIYVIRYFLRDC